MCDRPPPGGEPLLIAPKGPGAIFLCACMVANCVKQRLPRLTQRDVLSTGRFEWFIFTDQETNYALRRSREPLLNTKVRPSSLWKEYARILGHAQKRLPSRRWAIAHHMNAITAPRFSPYLLRPWPTWLKGEMGRSLLFAAIPSSLLHPIKRLLQNLEVAGVVELGAAGLNPFLFQRVLGRTIDLVENSKQARERLIC